MKEHKLTPNENYKPDESVAPVIRVYKLGEEPKDNVYWLSRPPQERLAMIEELRRAYYGEEYDLPRDPEKLFKVTVRKLPLNSENLVKTKTGTGRARDLSDIEDLQRQRG